MFKDLIRTSIFVLVLQKIQRGYRFILSHLYKIFIESQTYRLIMRFSEETKAGFRYSFLRRILKIETEANHLILDNSQIARWLSGVIGTLRFRMASYQGTSEVSKTIGGLKEEVRSFPFKAIGIILLTATLTNTLFSLVFNKEIRPFDWIIKAIFFFMGIGSLYSNADWGTIKKTSLFLRLMNNC